MDALLSTPNGTYVTCTNSVSWSKRLRAFFASSNFQNLFIGKFHLPMPCGNGHVFHVGDVISKVKMAWIYTKRHIAFVQNPLGLWYFSAMYRPGKSVREDSFVVYDDESIRTCVIRRTRSIPYPASRLGNWNEFVFHSVPKALRSIKVEFAAHFTIIRRATS